MSLLAFTKMHGLGNDFMVIDGVSQDVKLSTELIQRWSDRHTGLGFDQLLLVEPPTTPDVDFRYRIFNADGSEVEQCGNGARCFATFVRRQQLTFRDVIRVETMSGQITLNILEDGQVRVDMGLPIFEPKQVPFVADKDNITQHITIDQQQIDLSVVSMGNPHAVLTVDSVAGAKVESLGSAIETNEHFPQRVNVGFMEVINPSHIKLRVWERGVGETMACGTGACAAAVSAIRQHQFENKVTVSLPGGDLTLEWNPGEHVFMTGPASVVFDGVVEIQDD